ncbi:MAG TPA: hypothetical protein VF968_05470 [Actinomycetota bacterium]
MRSLRADLAEVVLDLGVAAPGLAPPVIGPREALDRSARVLPVPDPEERAAVAQQVAGAGVRVLDHRAVARVGLGLRRGRRRSLRPAHRTRAGRFGDGDVVRLLRDEAQPCLTPAIIGAREPLGRGARVLAIPDTEEAFAIAEHVSISGVRVLLRRPRRNPGPRGRLGRGCGLPATPRGWLRRSGRGRSRPARCRHVRGRHIRGRHVRGRHVRGRYVRGLRGRIGLLRHGFRAWSGQIAEAIPAFDRLVLDLLRAVGALLHCDPPALGGPRSLSLPSPLVGHARR